MNAEASDVPRGTSDTTAVAVARLPLPALQVAPGIAIVPLLQLQDDLEPFEHNLEDIEGQVERAEIGDQAAYQSGSDILTAIQAELNRLEAKRVEVKKPADDFGNMVQKLCNPLKDRLTEAKKSLNQKMLTWYNAEEARKKAAQDAIRKQQEAEAAALAAKAREQGQESTAAAIENMVAAAPTAPAPKVGMANYAGKTHGKRVYWNGAAHDPMEILKQIVAGNLPLHIVEFSKTGLNKVATDHIAKLPKDDQKDMVHLGIKITKDEKLV
jgi:hypothetical protein